ncbi:tetraspanin-32 [Phocoena phocoena]|uniref:tetraspanin-32 n=1 Tax=Phocoena phocoena TaxID=9742 RepID=UPI0033070287
MGPWSRVRVAKCQMLVTSLFVLLLGLAMATTAVLTYFGPHFAVIGHASSQRTRYEALHLWAFSTGITLAALLILGAVMSAAATVREAGGLMAGAFLCFALVFCALVQVAFWRCHNPTQVEDAVLDAYDQVYEQTVKSSSVIWRQELVAIQDMDCLQGIRNVLRMHGDIASTLISLGLASMVYVMSLSAFLWFAIRSGKYTLSPRARGCQPQEPHFYRRCQEGPAPHHLSEADALRGRRGPSSRSGDPPLLRDTHPPTHRSNGDAPALARTPSFPGGDELFSSTWWWDGEGGDPTRQAASM